jgi:hypothetical protein
MKRLTANLFISIFMVLGLVSTAHANAALELIKGIEVHGFASSSYSYNLNEPNDNLNDFRVYDDDDNSFKFDTGELVIKKDASKPGDVGFRTDLTYGFSNPRTNKSSGGANAATTDDDFDLQIAYVQYNAPIGNGLLIDFGKFATHVGAEVMDGYDGWNYNFSRSFLFNFGPFTHTGVRMQYAVSDTVGVLAMVSNGIDNQTDNNSAKGFGGQISWTPVDNVALYFNYFGTAEDQAGDTNNNQDLRNFYDVVADIGLCESVSLNLNFVYGSEDNARGANLDAEWWGFSGIVRYDVNEWFSLNVRGQVFDDTDGVRTGANDAPTVQQLSAFTITPEIRVNNNMVVRAEYRHDMSDTNSFTDDDSTATDTQDTVAINALFYF